MINCATVHMHTHHAQVLAMLKDRVGDQGAQLMALHQKALRCDQLEEETQQAHDHATMCSREVEHYKHHAATLEDELAGVKMQLAESNRELQKLKAVLARASHTIQASLQPVSSEAEQIVQRGSLLDTLLHLLKLTPTSVTQDHPTSLHHHTAGQASLPKFQYKPGDLGLVPAPHTNTQGHSLSHRPHMTELHSGGVDIRLPPLSTSPLTGNTVR